MSLPTELRAAADLLRSKTLFLAMASMLDASAHALEQQEKEIAALRLDLSHLRPFTVAGSDDLLFAAHPFPHTFRRGEGGEALRELRADEQMQTMWHQSMLAQATRAADAQSLAALATAMKSIHLDGALLAAARLAARVIGSIPK